MTLTNSHAPLVDALDMLREPLFILDGQRDCIFANRAFFSFFGLTPTSDRALSTRSFWPDVENIKLLGDELCCDLRLERGETFVVKLAVSTLPSGYTLLRVLAGLSRTDSMTGFHAQRLETLGMLAGGVAHDFNNILAGILGHVTYLKTILPPRGPHVESLRAVEDGAKKASSITAQILNFSKLDTAEEPRRVELRELVSRTCSLLRGAISLEYRLIQEVPDSPVYVIAVDGKLAQVVVNLVVNARDAVKSGGNIWVVVSECRESSRLAKAFGDAELPCARYATLEVRDDGHGMSESIIPKIFEPYFSTKKSKGTGLGLSTVSAIVRQFGGAIEVKSQIDVGTSITVFLPMVDASPAELRPKVERLPHLPTGTERILIVDDEYPVRNVLTVSLQHLGYKVEAAESGLEALERFRRAAEPFDLVILDMLMPQLSGDRVFAKLRELDPSVRVLVISGFSSEEAIQSILENGGRGFIQKPFTIEELARQVRRSIDDE